MPLSRLRILNQKFLLDDEQRVLSNSTVHTFFQKFNGVTLKPMVSDDCTEVVNEKLMFKLNFTLKVIKKFCIFFKKAITTD